MQNAKCCHACKDYQKLAKTLLAHGRVTRYRLGHDKTRGSLHWVFCSKYIYLLATIKKIE